MALEQRCEWRKEVSHRGTFQTEQQAQVLQKVAHSMCLKNSKETTVGHVELHKMNEFFPKYYIYNDDYMSPISQ